MQVPFQNFPGFLLRQATASAMSELNDILSAMKLRFGEAVVLIIIDSNPGQRQSKFGKELNIASANMAPLVNKLHDRGLIRRERLDGRSYALHTSEDGKALVEKVMMAMEAFETKLVEKIPKELQKPFLEALQHLAKAD